MGRKLSAAVAFAFRQFRGGLHPVVAGGGLVPISASVCRVVVHGVRSDAGSCAGGNRSWRNCGWCDTPPQGATESLTSHSVAAGRNCNASLISVFPGRIDSISDGRV